MPRSGEATDTLARILLRCELWYRGDGHEQTIGNWNRLPSQLQNELIDVLASDPPLLIYAALQTTAASGSAVGIETLARTLVDGLVRQLTFGDLALGAPAETEEVVDRFRRLTNHFATLPIGRWMDDATLWLETTGPRISAAWRSQWPSVIDDRSNASASQRTTSDDLLQGLARKMQQQVTLRESFDRQLHRQKMASLRQAAYGLSHEINNPLANISTRAQAIQRQVEDVEIQRSLDKVIDQVYRAHGMIADLMFYANPPELKPDIFDLVDLVRRVVDDRIEVAEKTGVELEFLPVIGESKFNGDADMLADAISVLIRNSLDAISGKGRVVVRLQKEDAWVVIEVADSGTGLSREATQHAFDPYYSGREAGRGLGLSLCRAYRIARLHHGDVLLEPALAGCVARLKLPLG